MENEKIVDQLEQVSQKILMITRDELYMNMKFFDVALSSFFYQMDEQVQTLATDGLTIYYEPKGLGAWFRQDRRLVNRGYLHLLLHCIFRHMIKGNNRKKQFWDLACDIVVESMIDSWYLKCIAKGQSMRRRETYRLLRVEYGVLTAPRVYRWLLEQELSSYELSMLEQEFMVDDHVKWQQHKSPKMEQEIQNKWQDISEKMETELQTFSKEASKDSGDFIGQLKIENKNRYDYRDFLRKFTVLGEEIKVDEDSFDYTFYTYGLNLYGNMPLIEPQEWKEVEKIQEFAIVIDTSMSCSGELVRSFLEETYDILSESESFFHQVKIHIVQCDESVQEDRVICKEDELKEYMEHLELKGEGGTDFRPAFAYIDELVAKGEFTHLKGILYFTDGQGIFPKQMPSYETAFVLIGEENDVDVPPWAMKLVVDLKGE